MPKKNAQQFAIWTATGKPLQVSAATLQKAARLAALQTDQEIIGAIRLDCLIVPGRSPAPVLVAVLQNQVTPK